MSTPASAPKKGAQKHNRASKADRLRRRVAQTRDNRLLPLGSLDPFPVRAVAQLRYSETLQFTVGAAGVASAANAWRLNDLYDPNYTGAGHQPYGFDQMMGLYAKFRVLKVSFEIRPLAVSDAVPLAMHAIVSGQLGGVSLAGLTFDNCKERPNVMTCIFGQLDSTTTSPAKLLFSSPIHKIFGMTEAEQRGSDGQIGTASASPTVPCYVNLVASCPTGTAGSSPYLTILLTYTAEFFDRVSQTQS